MRLVEQPDRVVALEARPQVVENPPRLFDASARQRARVRKRRASASSSWMYSLYSLSVVAATIRISPRASTDLKHVGGVRRRAERRAGADHRVRFVDEQNEVRPLLQLADDVLDAILEHAAQHRAGDHRVHLQVDDLAVAQADRHGFRLELDAPREPFDDGRLADARLADQHHGVGALAVAEDLQHLLDFLVAAEDRRQLVLARQQIQVGREVLEERRQLEALLQPLLAQLHVAHRARRAGDTSTLGLDAVAAQDRHRHALRLLEHRGKQVDRLDASAGRRGSRDGAPA